MIYLVPLLFSPPYTLQLEQYAVLLEIHSKSTVPKNQNRLMNILHLTLFKYLQKKVKFPNMIPCFLTQQCIKLFHVFSQTHNV